MLVVLPLVLLVTALAAGAQQTDAQRQGDAMAKTVLDQLEAFRRGDWTSAYRFASASIHSQFTPEAFRQMVTRGYAPIARPLQSRILATRVLDATRGFVEIRVEGQNGETIDALYELVEERGAWRVNGVISRPAHPRGELTRRPPATGPRVLRACGRIPGGHCSAPVQA
ncbi:MAG: DUF4864 domain-containing protein [Candidatus Rokuibacteriota bacterium]